MIISNEDLELIRKFEDIKKRGFYCNGKEVTDLHNKVLGTSLSSTNCSSCISARINALVEAANRFERMIAIEKKKPSEALKEVKVDNIPQDENKAVRKAKNKK